VWKRAVECGGSVGVVIRRVIISHIVEPGLDLWRRRRLLREIDVGAVIAFVVAVATGVRVAGVADARAAAMPPRLVSCIVAAVLGDVSVIRGGGVITHALPSGFYEPF